MTLAALSLWSCCVAAETIGLRFVVSDTLARSAAERRATQTALERNVMRLNEYFRNSAVDIVAEMVDVGFARIEAVDAVAVLEDMHAERGGFAGLFARADEIGADYTFAVMDKLMLRGKPNCGRAIAVNRTRAAIGSTREALAVVALPCGAQSLAHELGHLMGLNHGFAVDRCQPNRGHASAIARYANGYAVGACDGKPDPEKFGDIMVGGWMKEINGDGHSNLPMFSNPRIRDPRCGREGICGDPEIGDAARALNENARDYAAHEEPDVHTLRYASAAMRDCMAERYRGVEIADLFELDCRHHGIERLDGIERLVALKRIDLAGNQLQDVAALERLPDGLLHVDLSGNPRIPCRQIDRLAARHPGKVLAPATCFQD